MLFYFDSSGNLLKSVPGNVYQGSNKASIVYVTIPLPTSVTATANIKLPNGVYLKPQLVSNGAIPNTSIDGELNFALWSLELEKTMTAYAGDLEIQFAFYPPNMDKITTANIIIPILRGNPTVLPEEPTEDIYEQILTVLSQIYGEFSEFNDTKQNKIDDALDTESKDIVGAINELNDTKQDKEDENLETESKDVVGAINELKNAIKNIDKLTYKPVDVLPKIGENNIIYLVPNTQSTDKNIKDEYMWIDNDWELIGSTAVDLSDVVNNVQINDTSIVEEVDGKKVAKIPIATSGNANLGLIKAVSSGGIFIETNGNASLIKASENTILTRNTVPQIIASSNIDLALKIAITGKKKVDNVITYGNQLELTESEQQSVKDWLGISSGTQLYKHTMIFDRTTENEIGDTYYYKIVLLLPKSEPFNDFHDLLNYLGNNGLSSLFQMYYEKSGTVIKAYYNLINGGYHTLSNYFTHCTLVEDGNITNLYSLEGFIITTQTFEEYTPIPL